MGLREIMHTKNQKKYAKVAFQKSAWCANRLICINGGNYLNIDIYVYFLLLLLLFLLLLLLVIYHMSIIASYFVV